MRRFTRETLVLRLPKERRTWKSYLPVYLPIAATVISLISLGISGTVAYLQNSENHDLTAAVLEIRQVHTKEPPIFRLEPKPGPGTNSFLYRTFNVQTGTGTNSYYTPIYGDPNFTRKASPCTLDIVIINRGNQAELLRGLTLYYSPTNDGRIFKGLIREFKELNRLLEEGRKEIISVDLGTAYTRHYDSVSVSIGVVAVDSNLRDVERTWKVCELKAWKSFGIMWSDLNRSFVRVLGNKRLPHQRDFVSPSELNHRTVHPRQ